MDKKTKKTGVSPEELARRKKQSQQDKAKNSKKQQPQRNKARRTKVKRTAGGGAIISPQVPGVMKLVTSMTNNQHKAALTSVVLPAESPPFRLIAGMGVKTVLNDLSGSTRLVVPDVADNVLTNLYGGRVDGFLALVSKQPSRLFNIRNDTLYVDHGWYRNYKNGGAWTPSSFAPHPDFTAIGLNPFYVPSDSVFSIARTDITPAAWSSSDIAFYPRDHIGAANGKYYVWLSNNQVSADQLTITGIFKLKSTGSFAVTAVAQAQLFRYDGPDLETRVPTYSIRVTTTMNLTDTLSYKTAFTASFQAPTSGYYRVEMSEMELHTAEVGGITCYWEAPDPPGGALYYNLNVARAAGGFKWVQAPEFYINYKASPLYDDCRATALGVLFSNRTPPLNKGGYVWSRVVESECDLIKLMGNDATADSFRNACAVQPGRLGYEGDLAMGMYYWAKLCTADKNFRNFVSPLGSALYHLDASIPVAAINLLGNTSEQNMFIHYTLHTESAVTQVQSFGVPLEPTMTTAEYELICNTLANWPIFHENPTHVMDFLKRIGGGMWNGFKFASPYLARAALAAMNGSTPAGALMAALSNAIV